jgi:hypothetical protein
MTKFRGLILAGSAALLLSSCHTPANAGLNSGLYALSGTVTAITCTQQQLLAPFSHFFFDGALNPYSEFFFEGLPGSQLDIVSMPDAPMDPAQWRGKLRWRVNPFTFKRPGIRTQFSLHMRPVADRGVLIAGELEVPTSDGGTCMEAVAFTGIRTSGNP